MKIHPSNLEEYQKLIGVAQGHYPASVWFKNVHFLNVYTGQIDQGQIYIAGKRVAYVGDKQFLLSSETAVVELDADFLLVPGYIEPHAHPCQMYNPLSWGNALLSQGTVASVNDNLTLLMLIGQNALDFIEKLDGLGKHLWLWWCTFDAKKTGIAENFQLLQAWMTHPLVLQGGEFTAWSAFLKGDPDLLKTMFSLKKDFGKRVEGHLPGASLETLNALTASGIGADHESLNGDDILKRLRIGLYATLRYSSIRPDLPDILHAIAQHAQLNPARMMLTSDGSAPFFVEQASCANMLRLVMQAGLPAIDAYRMATLNPATYYGLDEDLGGIAPGRLACFNVLRSLDDPIPVHVMQEGEWVIRDKKFLSIDNSSEHARWLQHIFPAKIKNMLIHPDLIEQNTTTGIELLNDVITRPYTFSPETQLEPDECFISLIDTHGQWRVQTRLKNFSTGLLALASTYSASTDVIVIGRDKQLMCTALSQALELGGGIVALFEGGEQFHIPLPLSGIMSLEPMETLAEITGSFAQKMRYYGYPFADPTYTLLFLTATHLPFVRLTPDGVFLIKEQRIMGLHHSGEIRAQGNDRSKKQNEKRSRVVGAVGVPTQSNTSSNA